MTGFVVQVQVSEDAHFQVLSSKIMNKNTWKKKLYCPLLVETVSSILVYEVNPC